MPGADREIPLGGLITGAVRVGGTVRRPDGPAAFADGYRLDRAGRAALPATIAPMIEACAVSIVAKARAGEPAFVRLAESGALDGMAREARFASRLESPLRQRLLRP